MISYYFARPGPQTGRRPPSFWRKYHLACAGIIGGALVLAAVEGLAGWPDKGLLIAEWVAVWAFGASWFMKGFEIRRLFAEAKEPAPEAPAPSAAP